MKHNEWDDCFLLHQRAHGETSLIVDVFTRTNGKMSLIAKGAKKPKSKFFGYLAPFTKLKITYSGRSELKTLTNIDRDFSQSTNSLSKTSYSLLYINELLIRLLPKDASQEDLFNLYEDFLTKIHSGDDIEFTLRHFELDLLDMLGYGLDFESDIDKNEQIDPDKNGEIQITDALLSQAKQGKVIALKFKGKRFDCGSISGFVDATNHFAKKFKIFDT